MEQLIGCEYIVAVKRLQIILMVIAFLTIGCRQNPRSDAISSVLSIEQVTKDPQRFAHKLLTLRGCYVRSFERSTLQSCNDTTLEDSVWIESAVAEFAFRNIRQPFPWQYVPKELRTEPVAPDYFVFKYDEQKATAAALKLSSAGRKPVPVVVTGQFDTVAPNKGNPDWNDPSRGFGHLGQYKHRLILVDVLEVREK